MTIGELATVMEVYYTGIKTEEIVGTALYGTSMAVTNNDGLFGCFGKLFNIIVRDIHESWSVEVVNDDVFENTTYFQLVNDDRFTWKEKAFLLKNDITHYIFPFGEHDKIDLSKLNMDVSVFINSDISIEEFISNLNRKVIEK